MIDTTSGPILTVPQVDTYESPSSTNPIVLIQMPSSIPVDNVLGVLLIGTVFILNVRGDPHHCPSRN